MCETKKKGKEKERSCQNFRRSQHTKLTRRTKVLKLHSTESFKFLFSNSNQYNSVTKFEWHLNILRRLKKKKRKTNIFRERVIFSTTSLDKIFNNSLEAQPNFKNKMMALKWLKCFYWSLKTNKPQIEVFFGILSI